MQGHPRRFLTHGNNNPEMCAKSQQKCLRESADLAKTFMAVPTRIYSKRSKGLNKNLFYGSQPHQKLEIRAKKI